MCVLQCLDAGIDIRVKGKSKWFVFTFDMDVRHPVEQQAKSENWRWPGDCSCYRQIVYVCT